MKLHFEEISLTNWSQFEKLFGPRGACGGCWCMTWRLPRSVYESQKGNGNRKALKALVKRKASVGIIAFSDDEPVGWCSLAPREDFSRLKTSRILRPIDEAPVWSIVCFYIHASWRRKGVSERLIEAAVNYAGSKGARIVEAYPVAPHKNPMPGVFAFTGLASAFFKAGFTEVARRSETRPIVRFELRKGRTKKSG